MEKLAKREEQIMRAFWKLKKAFVKDIIAELPNPKPHYNSVSTMIRILEEKGFLNHKAYGKTHEYFPIVSELDYKDLIVESVVDRFFGKSYMKMFNFFVENEKLGPEDVERIIQIIKKGK